jgi:tRNA(Phe) wybutosine-synthesizing methylase Tyw3|tara:strand:- start:196 stop:450 length:255 start_codon:yes stop_codon:yes gene_type:complete
MSSDLQKQINMINDLYVSSSSSGRLFAMKQVIADLKQIIDKSVQSENDKYQGESMMKAMQKIADLMIRYQKEVNEEEQANKQKV